MAANGRVIVTGCLGAKGGKDDGTGSGNLVRQMHPSVLAVTGPHATEEVMDAVHLHVPKPHDPFVDLVPAPRSIGIKLTPKHYAYLKISEGCNHRCTFCIIPSLRGDLVSRPIGDVLSEAEALFESGVKELLVISQDTSAYGVDVRYRTGFWNGRPVKTQLLELCERLAEIAEPHGAWVRLHYVYPYPHVDAVLPLMASGAILPYLDIPFQHSHPDVLRRMKRPASGEKNLERLTRWREICPELVVRSTFIAGFPGETEEEFQDLIDFMRQARIDRAGCFAYSPVEGALANAIPACCRSSCARSAARASWPWQKPSRREAAGAGRCDHAGAGRFRAGARTQGRLRTQLRRCARDRRPGPSAAAGEGLEDAAGRRVHARQDHRRRWPRSGRRSHLRTRTIP